MAGLKKILIADDNEGIIDMLSLWIESKEIFQGVYVMIARSPRQAISMIADELPELVFLDLGLGNGLSGLEVLKSLKEQGLQKSRVLVFSGYAEYEKECLASGAFAFVKKGARLKEMEALIEKEFSS